MSQNEAAEPLAELDTEGAKAVVVAAVVAMSTLVPVAIVRADNSSHRVTIDQEAAGRLVAALDAMSPGLLDRIRASGGARPLRRPTPPTIKDAS